ncbi:hypothetical protein DL96DRAFT_1111722 [Flagelloscypha sp. PMI_526]|nr:hypothetical protein DL96DRAFT_1111722 [Flagelloscypha sp. PMI_526]
MKFSLALTFFAPLTLRVLAAPIPLEERTIDISGLPKCGKELSCLFPPPPPDLLLANRQLNFTESPIVNVTSTPTTNVTSTPRIVNATARALEARQDGLSDGTGAAFITVLEPTAPPSSVQGSITQTGNGDITALPTEPPIRGDSVTFSGAVGTGAPLLSRAKRFVLGPGDLPFPPLPTQLFDSRQEFIPTSSQVFFTSIGIAPTSIEDLSSVAIPTQAPSSIAIGTSAPEPSN